MPNIYLTFVIATVLVFLLAVAAIIVCNHIEDVKRRSQPLVCPKCGARNTAMKAHIHSSGYSFPDRHSQYEWGWVCHKCWYQFPHIISESYNPIYKLDKLGHPL